MLLIPCPNCGERDQREFDYGGPAIKYPALNSAAADWHRVIHLRENPQKLIDEFWFHTSGCECWIKVSRNVTTHEITCPLTPVDGATS